jgi:hypothetical protein
VPLAKQVGEKDRHKIIMSGSVSPVFCALGNEICFSQLSVIQQKYSSFFVGAREEAGTGVRHSLLVYGQLRLQAGKCENCSPEAMRIEVFLSLSYSCSLSLLTFHIPLLSPCLSHG